MNKCNAIIKTGPRKGLRCNYKKKTNIYCNKHNNEEKQDKQNINTLPNEIVNKIISYLEIKEIMNLKLTNKFFLLMCNNILNNFLNIKKLDLSYFNSQKYKNIKCS